MGLSNLGGKNILSKIVPKQAISLQIYNLDEKEKG
jgi:hypothetical protein